MKKEAEKAERAISSAVNDQMYALGSGDLNNLGQTLLQGGVGAMSMGQIDLGLETNTKRKTRELTEQAQSAAMLAQEEQDLQRVRNIEARTEASARARMRTPGLQQITLLGGAPQSGTLLTGR